MIKLVLFISNIKLHILDDFRKYNVVKLTSSLLAEPAGPTPTT